MKRCWWLGWLVSAILLAVLAYGLHWARSNFKAIEDEYASPVESPLAQKQDAALRRAHFVLSPDWTKEPHAAASRAFPAQTCFECHDPSSCQECHEREDETATPTP